MNTEPKKSTIEVVNMAGVPMEERMPEIRRKLREIKENLQGLTWQERDDYYTFLHSIDMAIVYSYGNRRM